MKPDYKHMIPAALLALLVLSVWATVSMVRTERALDEANAALDEAQSRNVLLTEALTDADTRLAEMEYALGVAMPRAGGLDTEDVTVPSGARVDDLRELLNNGQMFGIEHALLIAEDRYGINAYVLYAIAALESAHGTSRFAVERNNLTGFGAYTENPDNAASFATFGECIIETAKNLRTDYVDEGLTSLTAIGEKYAADPAWAAKVGSIAREAREGE